MNILKKLASDTAVYGLSSLLGRLLNYLLVPFHTLIFEPQAYGVVSVFYADAAFLNVIYLYGMETAFFRFVNRADFDKESVFNLIQTALIISSVLFSSFLFFFADFLSVFFAYPDSELYIQYFAFILGIDAILAVPFARLRSEGKAKRFASLKILTILLNIFFTIFFLWFCPKVTEGVFLANFQDFFKKFYDTENQLAYVFLANLLANASLLPFFIKDFFKFRFQVDWTKFSPIFFYAYPILFTGLTAAINEVADRNLLEALLPPNFYENKSSTDAVGIYSACYKLAIFISLAVQAFKYAAEPLFFAQAQQKNSPEIFAKIMKYFVIACAVMYLGVSLNLDILQFILQKPEYREGIYIVPFLLLANVFLGIYYNLAIWFKITDRTYFGTWIGLFGAVLTVLFNILLIPVWGYLGSAVATLLCYAAMAGLCYVIGQKYFPVPYDIFSAFLYLGLASVLIGGAFWFKIENLYLGFVFHNGLLLAFVAFFFWKEKISLRKIRRN